MRGITALACVATLAMASASHADTIFTHLTEDGQGAGNKGAAFRPVNELGVDAGFTMTARTLIDSDADSDWDASGQLGTICINEERFVGTPQPSAAGVQDINGGGTGGISGGGDGADEEITFHFDESRDVSTIMLGVSRFTAGNGLGSGDDVTIFLHLAETDNVVAINEMDFMYAYSDTGSFTGYIDFSHLELGGDITALTYRSNRGQSELTFIAFNAVPVPAGLGLGLAGLAGLGVVRRRRRNA